VLRALEFKRPDVMPSYDNFWQEFVDQWRRWKGFPADGRVASVPESAPSQWDIYEYYDNDVRIAAADETFWPSKATVLAPDGDHLRERDGWGRVVRKHGNFTVTETPAMPAECRDPDSLVFEPVVMESRYREFDRLVAAEKDARCVFAKIGGPFIRISFLRGMETWLSSPASWPRSIQPEVRK